MPVWPQPALPAQWTGTANLPPFVGRRRELDLLEATWPSVEQGARQVVFVGGEPGAGKSRLVAEASIALDRLGMSVLVGSCSQELGQPFDPFVRPVRLLLPAIDRGELALEGEGVTSADEARDLLRLFTAGTTRGPGPIAGARAAVVFDAVVALLRSASSARPLVLVLEDLHWAGESALRILRFVVEKTAELPVLVLATFRSTPPDRSDLLSTAMAELMRLDGVHRADLAGLDTNEVTAYLAAAHAGAPSAVRHAAALLRDNTGGNPFILRELWRDLDRKGGLAALESGELTPPDSLRAVLTSRLAALPEAQRRLVFLASVIGEEFGPALLRAAAGTPPPSSEEVFAAMGAAAGLGLLDAGTGDPNSMRFPHALARQAVMESMSPFDLAAAHAQVGFALEEGFAAQESRVQRLAHHFSAAVGLGLEDRAARYLEQAGSDAMARLANSDAAVLFERAAGFVGDPSERDRLLLRAARCHHMAGHLSRAQELDERVSTSGHPTHRLAAAIGFEAAKWRSGGADALRAVALLQSAMTAAPGEEPERTQILGRAALGRALALSGRREEGLPHTQRAVAAARQKGDEPLLMATLERAITLQAHISPREGLSVLREQLAAATEVSSLAKRRGELRALATGSQMRIFGSYVMGDPEGLEAARADLALSVRVTRQPYWHWCEYLVDASRLMMRCAFGEAARTIAQGREVERAFEQEDTRVEGPWSLQSFMLRRETGALEFARGLLQAGQVPEDTWRPGLAALSTELGLADQARVALREALEQDLARMRLSSTWPAALSFLGEAACWLGDREAARVLLAEAECFAGLNLFGAEFLATLGSADRLLAMLKGTLGLPGVEEHFGTALAMDQRMGSTLHVATTQAEWAAHLRRRRAPAGVVEGHAAPARELADRFDLVRVRRILGPDGGATRPAPPDGLTARELDVLNLIGRGRSNRDIAHELFISENTAANHVRSILMKTGCANRTAAAHYAMERGLLDQALQDGRH